MSAQPEEVRTILARIARLEEQNRRLKQIAACGFLFLSVAFLCVVSAGGQQEPKGQSDTARQSKKSTPGFTPVQPPYWKLKDGRLVVVPPSMEAEKVNAAAVVLPPGTKVIGWEPVEGAKSLLPYFAERVSTIPTTKDKLAALASAADILQNQVGDLNFKLSLLQTHVAAAQYATLKNGNTANENTKTYNAAIGNLDYRVQQLELNDSVKRGLDRLQTELDDFKDAACPTLCAARNRTARLDSVCSCALR